MRVLFVSASPIQKEISIGNTFLNLFAESEDVTLASVYTRDGVPDASISEAFCMTDAMLVKNLLRKTPVGKTVTRDVDALQSAPAVQDGSRLIRFIKRTRLSVFFFLQDFLWRIGRWKSPELQKFVQDFQPDIVFTVLSDFPYLNRLILHIVKTSGAKLTLYAWDNNYSFKIVSLSPFRWIRQVSNRASMRKVVAKADLFYVISDVQKQDYEKAFQKPCKVLTKFADFSESPQLKSAYNTPLQLVFTGNIGTNRWKTLALIANALRAINHDGTKAELRIYTATPLTAKIKKALDIDGVSYLMGTVPASDIPRIQSEADILVHTEALDLKNKLAVRQSFSTKLVDYFKAARPILAVGPKDVASIDHLLQNNCALVADNEAEIIEKLSDCIDNPELLNTLAENAFACGKRHHDTVKMKKMLYEDLKNTITK